MEVIFLLIEECQEDVSGWRLASSCCVMVCVCLALWGKRSDNRCSAPWCAFSASQNGGRKMKSEELCKTELIALFRESRRVLHAYVGERWR